MAVQAAGAFRRSSIERSDQRVAWERADQAFFAAGACHVLGGHVAMLSRNERLNWLRCASPASSRCFTPSPRGTAGRSTPAGTPRQNSLDVNEAFEGHPLERVGIAVDLTQFCGQHHHRMPNQYWQDPQPRARDYVARHVPPWESIEGRTWRPLRSRCAHGPVGRVVHRCRVERSIHTTLVLRLTSTRRDCTDDEPRPRHTDSCAR
jgi:hypothetical protein